MGTLLDKIVATKRGEIESGRSAWPAAQLCRAVSAAPAPRDFLAALRRPGPIRLIAEIKKASPSAGLLRADFQPAAIGRAYQDHGATCISVLTDATYFQGSLDHLRQVRATVDLPVLRKDFILDRYQLCEARAAGADAVLLIAECLDDRSLRGLLAESVSLGLTPLVEFHEPDNLQRVVDSGARLIGINNRDLRTFEVDLQRTLRLRDAIPAECVVVSESGIRDPRDVGRLEAARVDAMLVGETLMRQPDIGRAVDQLLGRGS